MRTRLRAASAVCAACPVATACLREAVDLGDVGYRGDVLLVRDNQSMAATSVRMVDRQLQPCGTYAAWGRHRRYGEPSDPACDAARAQYVAERRRTRRQVAA